MPIVVTSLPDAIVFTYEGAYSDADLHEALEQLRGQLECAAERGSTSTLLSITSRDAVATFRQRAIFVDWLEENDDLLRAACRAHAVVLHTPLQLAVYSALLWLKPYSVPIRAFANETEADAWLREFRR